MARQIAQSVCLSAQAWPTVTRRYKLSGHKAIFAV